VTFGDHEGALSSLQDIVASNGPIAISIDGRAVKDAPGPKGLPFVGNHFDVFPDHLGNHQRLFETYGPVIKTESLGRVTYLTNDPTIAAIVFAESDFFTKEINKAHPLYPIKNKAAGVFLGDTNTEEWRVAHKFLPPALGPKAVRHYAPTMQKTVEDAFSVFDELDGKGEAWNVYHYMLKLGSQAVGKLVLGMDFNHFTSPTARPAEMVMLIAEMLELNKKIASKGDWYSKLPFWEPAKLKALTARMMTLMQESIERAESSGAHDLPLQEAALESSNMVGKCCYLFQNISVLQQILIVN
jgi:cytochrome P450